MAEGPNLPNPAQVVSSLFSAIGQYIEYVRIKNAFSIVADFLGLLSGLIENITTDIAEVFRNVKEAWIGVKPVFDHVGGNVKGIAVDNHDMWYHLRYVLMPNTINYIWDWVWVNWIKPLRKDLSATIGWAGRWDWYLLGRVHDTKTYTYDVQVTGRNYREQYVYPQLQFALSPWRVAYWFAQQITVAVATYLNYPEHQETRDTTSRVVYSSMGRLWQSFDKHLAEWLLTDVSGDGWGVNPPTWPTGANQPPPGIAPNVWEPFVNEPTDPAYPAGSPDIPPRDLSA